MSHTHQVVPLGDCLPSRGPNGTQTACIGSWTHGLAHLAQPSGHVKDQLARVGWFQGQMHWWSGEHRQPGVQPACQLCTMLVRK